MFTFKYGEAPLDHYEHYAGMSLATLQDRPPQRASERTVSLHKDIARDLNTVQNLFDEWERDMRRKRNEALHAMDFPDLDKALTVFNYYGERHVGHQTLQDYFFIPRRATASASFSSVASHPLHGFSSHTFGNVADDAVCTRCGTPITRHAEFFIDTAKRRFEADRLCRPCLVYSAQKVFEAAQTQGIAAGFVESEVQRLREIKWTPRINVELADMLLDMRTFFS